MTMFQRAFPTTRRRVLQLLGLLGVGGSELARTAEALADSPGQWPEMTYRTLGRTGFRGSRLVFGCGAALMFWGKDELLEAATTAITEAAKTGSIGDGKLFISDVEQAIRIRTGEMGDEAL